jgi:hypothetical protein
MPSRTQWGNVFLVWSNVLGKLFERTTSSLREDEPATHIPILQIDTFDSGAFMTSLQKVVGFFRCPMICLSICREC